MDLMKVLDQAVREIKREVNLKVLNVPEIEQKVLDATSSEPWGPHGSALSEIAQATKKFAECSMIMNVLWARLSETDANWRHVYKALTVIEYLIANGSERAVDDILEHTYKIASLSGFEYVEPNGKDVGINVRKKVETLVALVNDKEKMQTIRNKASANRDKYIGLSSSGITYKSSASSYSSSSFPSNYGGFGSSKEGDSFRDNKYSEEHAKETKWNTDRKSVKSKEGLSNEKGETKLRKGGLDRAGGSVHPHSSMPVIQPDPVPLSSDDDFDDFDPRGSSTATNKNSNEVNLFGESLVGNLLDEPTSAPTVAATVDGSVTTEVDLFADATFVSASPERDATINSKAQGNIDFFSSAPDFPAAVPTNVDLFADSGFGSASDTKASSTEPTNTNVFDPFAASESGVPSEVPISTPESTKTKTFDPFAASESSVPSEVRISTPESTKTKTFDPFAGIPMKNFEGADLFGAFTSHTEQASSEPPQNSTNNSLNNLDQTSLTSSKPALKKDNFKVKSGIWADSLSRGLIDLNITAPKKTNLADIGIVGGLGDVSEEKDKGLPSSMHMGRAMGGGGTFSTLGQQQYRSFK